MRSRTRRSFSRVCGRGLASRISTTIRCVTCSTSPETSCGAIARVDRGGRASRSIEGSSSGSRSAPESRATSAARRSPGATNLATDYEFTMASCGGGAPRFQINIDARNIFVYLGPYPNYTGCAQNIWTSSGNLVTAGSFVDTSQLPGGTFYDTWSSALTKYGNDFVTGIQLVTDSGWFFGATATQTVLVDNVMINGTTYTFESTTGGGGGSEGGRFSQDKNGGCKTFTAATDPLENQGQCVSHFARQHENGGGDDDGQGDEDDD